MDEKECIVLTNVQMDNLMKSPTLDWITKDREKLPVELRWWLMLVVKEITPKLQVYLEERDKLYQEYSDKYEADVYVGEGDKKKLQHKIGDVVYIPTQKGMMYSTVKNQKLINDEIQKLASQECKFSDLEKAIIPPSVVKLLSAEDMIVLSYIANLKMKED